MHFAKAFALSATFLFMQISSAYASPTATPDSDAVGTVYQNVTRSINGEFFSAVSPCVPTYSPCARWCNDNFNSDSTEDNDCAGDCQEDYCDFAGVAKIEFPQGSGEYTEMSVLVDRARDEKLARLHAGYVDVVSPQPEDLANCLGNCVTFANFAGFAGKAVLGSIAQGLARTACPYVCYKIYS